MQTKPNYVRYVRQAVRVPVRHETRMDKGLCGMCGMSPYGRAPARTQNPHSNKSIPKFLNPRVPAHTAHTAHRLYSCGFPLCAIFFLFHTTRTKNKSVVEVLESEVVFS